MSSHPPVVPSESPAPDQSSSNGAGWVWASWFGCIWLVGWGWCVHLLQWQHPPHWPFTLGVAWLVLVSILPWGRVVLGPNRRRRLANLAFTSVPALLLLATGLHVHNVTSRRIISNRPTTRLMAGLGASLGDLEATIRYPGRTVGRRVVMVHDGDIADPAAQVAAMDAHIERMEDLLGESTPVRSHWIRGTLIGRSSYSFLGLAMSDPPGEELAPGELLPVDRHELAHATIGQFLTSRSFPPFVLIEGWAQAMSGDDSAALAQAAWHERASGGAWRLRQLLSEPWASRDHGPVYSIGGALVDFLLRKHGGPGFLKLYRESRGDTAISLIETWTGRGLDELEADFWSDVRAQLAPRREVLRAELLAVGRDAELPDLLWQELANGVADAWPAPLPALNGTRRSLRFVGQDREPTEGATTTTPETEHIACYASDDLCWGHSLSRGALGEFERQCVADGERSFAVSREPLEPEWRRFDLEFRRSLVAGDAHAVSQWIRQDLNVERIASFVVLWQAPQWLCDHFGAWRPVAVTEEQVEGERRVRLLIAETGGMIGRGSSFPQPPQEDLRAGEPWELVLAPERGWRCVEAWERRPNEEECHSTFQETTDPAGDATLESAKSEAPNYRWEYRVEPLPSDEQPHRLADFELETTWSTRWRDLRSSWTPAQVALSSALCLLIAGFVLRRGG